MNILELYNANGKADDEVIHDLSTEDSKYSSFFKIFKDLEISDFKGLNESAKLSFLNQGVTYALYKENESVEQIFPFDLIPRIIKRAEWEKLEKGISQRNIALNLFIHDIYHEGKILRDKVFPESLIKSSSHYCSLMEKFSPRKKIYTHICGTDIIRHSDGNFYVLEDNLRNPSGVSYVLTNRIAMNRVLPQAFQDFSIEPVAIYNEKLLQAFWSVSGKELGDIFCVLLTPGPFNSAYFEHTYLAQKMGIELVEGRDLFVEDDIVYLHTIGERIRVDVIYRRIDDAFLDPMLFRSDSILGVDGLMRAYLKGNVTIVNAPGTGISDDKAACAYVPDMIKYYLGEEPIIQNVPTYICDREKDLKYVLEHLKSLVVKPVDMSGGYGVCICDQMTTSALEELSVKIRTSPRDYIAQPKMHLSMHTTFIEDEDCFEPRHIDLRTFTILDGQDAFVLPGGLTRTALVKGSLIVNSSQGGGSKDTWILEN